MAKVKSRPISKHSRAARRATSPSLNTDKSLKDIPLPSGAGKHGPLGPSPTGISKKNKVKQLTRQQRLRKERGMARAEDNLEKLAVKVQKSGQSGNKVKERRKEWEGVNAIKKSKGLKILADESEAKMEAINDAPPLQEDESNAEIGVVDPVVNPLTYNTATSLPIIEPVAADKAEEEEEDIIL